MIHGDSLSSLSLASSLSGGISLLSRACAHMAGTGEGQPAQVARPDIICVYRACGLSICPSSNYGGVFMRNSGYSLSFSF